MKHNGSFVKRILKIRSGKLRFKKSFKVIDTGEVADEKGDGGGVGEKVYRPPLP